MEINKYKNYKYNYSFDNQFQKLISFDKIRIGKILEIFQYSLISYVFVIITVTLLNKFVFTKTKEEIVELSTRQLIIQFFFELFFLIIVLFYLRKIIMLFPSLPALYISGFQEQTVMDYVLHTALVFFFLEIITNIKFKMEVLHDRLKKFHLEKR
jgi:hypothetical protein